MKLLRFQLLPQSLVSMRLPFTWQAATSYPLPPPSTVLGLLANALWETRKREHPLGALEELEGAKPRVWARALGPMPATYTTLTTWFSEGGVKSNILPRQFLFAPAGFEVFVLLESETLLGELKEALVCAPLYLGDSEGLVSVSGVEVLEAEVGEGEEVPEAELLTYFPLNAVEGEAPEGTLFWVNERCIIRKSDEMEAYLFPVVREGKVWRLAKRDGGSVRLKRGYRVFKLEGLTLIGKGG